MSAYPEGSDPDDSGHYGMAIMSERARRLGGSLTVERAPSAGTRVRLQFPAEQSPSESRP
jgi:nitrate/nitrite-specific signal transduction histidine kinase